MKDDDSHGNRKDLRSFHVTFKKIDSLTKLKFTDELRQKYNIEVGQGFSKTK